MSPSVARPLSAIPGFPRPSVEVKDGMVTFRAGCWDDGLRSSLAHKDLSQATPSDRDRLDLHNGLEIARVTYQGADGTPVTAALPYTNTARVRGSGPTSTEQMDFYELQVPENQVALGELFGAGARFNLEYHGQNGGGGVLDYTADPVKPA